MNPSEAKRWIDYSETDLRAAHALLESEEFFTLPTHLMSQKMKLREHSTWQSLFLMQYP